jgi:glutamate-1-semialdehyde 2,1-aminomutase
VTTVATNSELLHHAAARLVPGGTHSNSRLRRPYPVYFERAEGAYLFDVDGNRYVDFTMGNAAVALGHGHPAVTAAVEEALAAGLTAGYETRAAAEAVELLAEIVPGFGKARFANTGTEAAMHALRIARAATGRDRIAKPEGSYHGWYDDVWVSTWGAPADIGPPSEPASPPGSRGLSAHAAETLVLPFNDVEATDALLDEHGRELAAVILEPVMIDLGWVPASREYLEHLRARTADLGVVLVFDELLTGFRVAPGGARELYGVVPDLTLYGKALANGFPLAAVEGRADLLDLTDAFAGGPVSYVGTFNGHAIAAAACVASLGVLRDGAAQARFRELTERLQAGLSDLAGRYGVDVVAAGGGGHFQPYFTTGPVVDYRSALATNAAHYEAFAGALARHSILVAEKPLLHSALSLAHTEEHVDELLAGAEEAFAEIAEGRA